MDTYGTLFGRWISYLCIMRSGIIQMFISLLLIAGIILILFVFLFKGGNLTHRQLWHVLLGLFLVVLVVLNLRPHWSIEKKHRRFFEEFLSETDTSLQRKLFDNPALTDVDSAIPPSQSLSPGVTMEA